MYNYAITAIKVQDPVFISDYENFIAVLHKKYPRAEFEYHFEEARAGVSDRLHIHGTITHNRKVKFTNLTKDYKQGWSFKWKEDPDSGWHRYCVKRQADETNLINREHELEREYKQFNKVCFEPEALASLKSLTLTNLPIIQEDSIEKYRFPNWDIRKCEIS